MCYPPALGLANIRLAKREPDITDDAKLFERYMDDVLRSILENGIEEKVHQIN